MIVKNEIHDYILDVNEKNHPNTWKFLVNLTNQYTFMIFENEDKQKDYLSKCSEIEKNNLMWITYTDFEKICFNGNKDINLDSILYKKIHTLKNYEINGISIPDVIKVINIILLFPNTTKHDNGAIHYLHNNSIWPSVYKKIFNDDSIWNEGCFNKKNYNLFISTYSDRLNKNGNNSTQYDIQDKSDIRSKLYINGGHVNVENSTLEYLMVDKNYGKNTVINSEIKYIEADNLDISKSDISKIVCNNLSYKSQKLDSTIEKIHISVNSSNDNNSLTLSNLNNVTLEINHSQGTDFSGLSSKTSKTIQQNDINEININNISKLSLYTKALTIDTIKIHGVKSIEIIKLDNTKVQNSCDITNSNIKQFSRTANMVLPSYTNFDGTAFPIDADHTALYMYLKDHFSKIGNSTEALKFTKISLKSKVRLQDTKHDIKLFTILYGCISNYGTSIYKPLLLLILPTIIVPSLYSYYTHSSWDIAIIASIKNTIPSALLTIVSTKDALAILLIKYFHIIWSMAMYYLIFLAIRNNFKIRW